MISVIPKLFSNDLANRIFLAVSSVAIVNLISPARAEVCMTGVDWGTNSTWVRNYQNDIDARDQAGQLTIGLAEHAVSEMKHCVAVFEQSGALSDYVTNIQDWITRMQERISRAKAGMP